MLIFLTHLIQVCQPTVDVVLDQLLDMLNTNHGSVLFPLRTVGRLSLHFSLGCLAVRIMKFSKSLHKLTLFAGEVFGWFEDLMVPIVESREQTFPVDSKV